MRSAPSGVHLNPKGPFHCTLSLCLLQPTQQSLLLLMRQLNLHRYNARGSATTVHVPSTGHTAKTNALKPGTS